MRVKARVRVRVRVRVKVRGKFKVKVECVSRVEFHRMVWVSFNSSVHPSRHCSDII